MKELSVPTSSSVASTIKIPRIGMILTPNTRKALLLVSLMSRSSHQVSTREMEIREMKWRRRSRKQQGGRCRCRYPEYMANFAFPSTAHALQGEVFYIRPAHV